MNHCKKDTTIGSLSVLQCRHPHAIFSKDVDCLQLGAIVWQKITSRTTQLKKNNKQNNTEKSNTNRLLFKPLQKEKNPTTCIEKWN